MQRDNDGNGTRTSIWSRPRSRWLLGIPVGGFLMILVGILLTNGVTAGMDATSTPDFCASACHYMRDFVSTEVARSVHGHNRSGVRATCPDCHVPKPLVPKLIRKVEAAREGWGHITGVIATREKFEAKRLEMAERVWATMQATDSRECRTCHAFETMNPEEQGKMAVRRHQSARAQGKTCIDCHKGVAHELPAGYEG